MELLTVSEVAKILRVNKHLVYDLINEGEIKAMRIGSIKVRKEALEDYLERKEHEKW